MASSECAEEKVAIVTGAASGIGKALSQELNRQGWKVACVDVDMANVTGLAETLGPNAMPVKADVGNYSDQVSIFEQVRERWGRIDCLCANAGIIDRHSLYLRDWRGKDGPPPEPDLTCTDVDWKAIIYGTVLAIHYMRKNRIPGGKIICTASIAGVFPYETLPEYAGAKAAVINFVRSAAPLLKRDENITLNTVLPGTTWTDRTPAAMIESFTPERLTPVSTVVAGYCKFLDDDTLFGQVLECSVDKLLFYDPPAMANGELTKSGVTVWEPLHKMIHGEKSGLPHARH